MKKAFTLIELLAVIIMLGILITIVVPNVYSILNKTKQRSYDTLIDIIESDADLYVSRHFDEINNMFDENNQYRITLQQLVDEGLLKEPVINPKTDDQIPLNKVVIVTKNSNLTLTFCYEDNNCS